MVGYIAMLVKYMYMHTITLTGGKCKFYGRENEFFPTSSVGCSLKSKFSEFSQLGKITRNCNLDNTISPTTSLAFHCTLLSPVADVHQSQFRVEYCTGCYVCLLEG